MRFHAVIAGLALVMASASLALAQVDPGEMLLRLDRLEGQNRQLNGQIEKLQFRTQQLEQQLKRFQDDIEFRLRDEKGSAHPPVPPAALPQKRSETEAGNGQAGAGVGVPGGRETPEEPFDLSTLSREASEDPTLVPPPPAPREQAMPTLPPSASPKDEYDLAYGYVLRRDYALAETTFQGFIKKNPADRLVPSALYWMGESFFQRQMFRDAGQSFLKVVTEHPKSERAPDAMLRLGQSLAALGQKDEACSTFSQLLVKFPQASANVRQLLEREQRRVRC